MHAHMHIYLCTHIIMFNTHWYRITIHTLMCMHIRTHKCTHILIDIHLFLAFHWLSNNYHLYYFPHLWAKGDYTMSCDHLPIMRIVHMMHACAQIQLNLWEMRIFLCALTWASSNWKHDDNGLIPIVHHKAVLIPCLQPNLIRNDTLKGIRHSGMRSKL